jgi:hypothetical protein
MKNLKIGVRLGTAFAFLLVLRSLVSGIGILRLNARPCGIERAYCTANATSAVSALTINLLDIGLGATDRRARSV